MSIPLDINGTEYQYPEVGDLSWGPDATDWAVAVTTGMLQKAGGLFILLAEVDFGATYGLKSAYFKSRTTNPAAAGALRLANLDVISWRNNANDADLFLSVNASDELLFNGVSIGAVASVADTSTIDLDVTGNVLTANIVALSITDALVSPSANIAYSKLDLLDSIVNADINSTAAIAYSKLNLAASIVEADMVPGTLTNASINASAGIVYSKLVLTNSVVNADIATGAAIALNKLAALTASRALQSSAGGVIEVSSVTSTELAYVSGATSNIQGQLDVKQPLDAELTAIAALAGTGIIVHTGAGTMAERTIVGTSGQIAVTNGSGVSGNIPIGIEDDVQLPGTGGMIVPIGTTAQRSILNVDGTFRYNSETGFFEGLLPTGWTSFGGSSGGISFRAQKSSAQAVSTVTDTVVVFDVAAYNITGSYNASTGVFTAPEEGRYHFDACWTWASVAAAWSSYIAFQVNGAFQSVSQRQKDIANEPFSFPISAEFDLNPGDTVTVIAWQNSGSNKSIITNAIYNWFNGHKIA